MSIPATSAATSPQAKETAQTAQPPRPNRNQATTLNGLSPASVSPPQAKEAVQPPRLHHKHTATLHTQSLVSRGVQVARGTHLVLIRTLFLLHLLYFSLKFEDDVFALYCPFLYSSKIEPQPKKNEWQAVKPKTKPLTAKPKEPIDPFAEWMQDGFTSSTKQGSAHRRSQTLGAQGSMEQRKDEVEIAKQIAAQYDVPGQYLEACHSAALTHGASFSLIDLMRLTTAILHAPIPETEKMKVLGRLQNGDPPTDVAAELRRVFKGESRADETSFNKISQFFGGSEKQQRQPEAQVPGIERSHSAVVMGSSSQKAALSRHSASSSNLVASMSPSQQRALMQQHMQQRATSSHDASRATQSAANREKRTQSCAINPLKIVTESTVLESPAREALKKSGRGKGQCMKLKMKLATWEANVQRYWKIRNRLYEVVDEAKFFIMDGHALLQEGLRMDMTCNFALASSNYTDGLAKWDIAMAMIPSESIVAKLLGNHKLDFSKRIEEIDSYIEETENDAVQPSVSSVEN